MSIVNFNTVQTQFVIFFAKNKSIDFEQLALSIKSLVQTQFVSPANYTNIPDFAPAEIPRLEMKSVDQRIVITVSNSTLTFTVRGLNNEILALFASYINTVKVLADLVSSYGNLTRVGYVTTQTIDHLQPYLFIRDNILKSNINNAFEASIRIVLLENESGIMFNDSFTFDQGEHLDGQTKKTIVLITRDINMPIKTDQVISSVDIYKFIEMTYKNLNLDRVNSVFGLELK